MPRVKLQRPNNGIEEECPTVQVQIQMAYLNAQIANTFLLFATMKYILAGAEALIEDTVL